jgi:hypothetical protein
MTGPARRAAATHPHGPHPSTQIIRRSSVPSFETTRPIEAALTLGAVAANITVTADEGERTTVEVRPADPDSARDVRAAEQTQVDYADGVLTVTVPTRLGTIFGRTGAIEVAVRLPAGSRLRGETGMGELRCEGRLAECRFRSGYGDLRLDQVGGAVNLRSGMGGVDVDHAGGQVEVSTGSGTVHLRRVDGATVVKNSNGDTWIGQAAGPVRVKAANGSVTVERAGTDVTATTARGDIRLGAVGPGSVAAETAAGRLEIGVRAGVPAWLDVKTTAGRVRSELTAATEPDESEQRVEIRARTQVGDITIRRVAGEE